VTSERACIAPESNVGATSHQISPFFWRRKRLERNEIRVEKTCHGCKETLQSQFVMERPVVAQENRVRLREARASPDEQVEGDSAGGIIPRDWQMEKRQSQRSAETMLRRSEAIRWGWKSKGPSRWQAGSERGIAVDQATNFLWSGVVDGGNSCMEPNSITTWLSGLIEKRFHQGHQRLWGWPSALSDGCCMRKCTW
jgi:hypothetical protein